MKKMTIVGAAVLAGAIIAGCNKNEEPKAGDEPAANPNEALIEVNGQTLTRGGLDATVEKFFAAQGDKIPEEQREFKRQQLRNGLAQEFLFANALAAKAKADGYTITAEDRKAKEQEVVKYMAGRPDAPKTFEEFLEKNPLGKEWALNQFEQGILIDKMIQAEADKAITNNFTAEANTIIQNIVSNNLAQAEAETNALKKIQALRAELTSPACTNVAAKFAELAKANSACPSREHGGNLSIDANGEKKPFTHGVMVKEFDEAAFSLPVGKVSEPVKTQFGYHLILVTEKIPAVAAKDGKPAEPEKVCASHILIKGGQTRPVPAVKDVEEYLKNNARRGEVQRIVMEVIKASNVKATDEFKHLLPPDEAPKTATPVAPAAK